MKRIFPGTGAPSMITWMVGKGFSSWWKRFCSVSSGKHSVISYLTSDSSEATFSDFWCRNWSLSANDTCDNIVRDGIYTMETFLSSSQALKNDPPA